ARSEAVRGRAGVSGLLPQRAATRVRTSLDMPVVRAIREESSRDEEELLMPSHTIAASVIGALIADIGRLPEDWHKAGSVSTQVLGAIARLAVDRRIEHSLETGSGKTTLLLSHLSADHTVFAIEHYGDEDTGSITNVRKSRLFNAATVTFVEGPTQTTLPPHAFRHRLQLAMIDGPHGYPFPELELLPHLSASRRGRALDRRRHPHPHHPQPLRLPARRRDVRAAGGRRQRRVLPTNRDANLQPRPGWLVAAGLQQEALSDQRQGAAPVRLGAVVRSRPREGVYSTAHRRLSCASAEGIPGRPSVTSSRGNDLGYRSVSSLGGQISAQHCTAS